MAKAGYLRSPCPKLRNSLKNPYNIFFCAYNFYSLHYFYYTAPEVAVAPAVHLFVT